MPQSNPQRMVQTPSFSPNVIGNMASMDQRASDALPSDINKSENTLVAVKEEIKK